MTKPRYPVRDSLTQYRQTKPTAYYNPDHSLFIMCVLLSVTYNGLGSTMKPVLGELDPW